MISKLEQYRRILEEIKTIQEDANRHEQEPYGERWERLKLAELKHCQRYNKLCCKHNKLHSNYVPAGKRLDTKAGRKRTGIKIWALEEPKYWSICDRSEQKLRGEKWPMGNSLVEGLAFHMFFNYHPYHLCRRPEWAKERHKKLTHLRHEQTRLWRLAKNML